MATSTGRLGLRKPDPADLVNVATDLNENFDKIDDPFYAATLAADKVVRGKVDADTNERWHITADGKIKWGPGNAVTDTELYRDSAGVLRTAGGLVIDADLSVGDDLVVVGDLTVGGAISLSAGSLETADLANDAVTQDKIADGAVGVAQLGLDPRRTVDSTQYNGLTNTSYSATAGGVAELEIQNIFFRGGLFVVMFKAELDPDADGEAILLSFQVRKQSDSTEVIAADDARAIRNGAAQASAQGSFWGGTTGGGLVADTEYKVRLMHRVVTGSANIDNRELLIFELS